MAPPASSTITDEPGSLLAEGDSEIPGLVVIFSCHAPACLALPLHKDMLVFGREPADDVFVIEDDRISRRQTRISLVAEGVRVTDLGSRNGTFVDGRRIDDETFTELPRILRIGQTLLRFTPNIAPFLIAGGVCWSDGGLVSPSLLASRKEIERAAAVGAAVLITGPSGSGKELAARAYHAATGRTGPFMAVNCAAIPAGLAERLLFGARRGAYSGATTDAQGYAQAADGGTLFLDEIAELDGMVQPKLLRMLEQKEVLELGASRPRKVDVRVCAATHKDLRQEVAARRFREDLYYRIGRPEVRIPALVERLEELPHLAAAELARIDARLTMQAIFLEAAALRAWPGNVREFLLEVRQSARAALDAGRTLVEPRDMSPTAGQALAVEPEPRTAASLSRDAILEALRREHGNVTRAARDLGLHRNQLRRWITHEGLDPTSFESDSGEREAE